MGLFGKKRPKVDEGEQCYMRALNSFAIGDTGRALEYLNKSVELKNRHGMSRLARYYFENYPDDANKLLTAAQLMEQAEAAVEQRHDALYADAEAGLKDKQEGYLAQLGGGTSGGSYQAAFSDIRVKEGDTIRVTAGSGFLLLAGSGDLACAGKKTIDLSNGWEKGSGALTQGRRYLVMEDTVAKFISATHMGMRENPASICAPGMGIFSTAMAS